MMQAQGPIRTPASPRDAATCPSPIDGLLDPALFKALSDPTRLRLLGCLIKCRRPCSVSEIAECCSVDFSVVTRHLAHLARAGVVEGHKRGRTLWYEPACAPLAARLRSLAEALETPGSAPCGGGGEADACC